VRRVPTSSPSSTGVSAPAAPAPVAPVAPVAPRVHLALAALVACLLVAGCSAATTHAHATTRELPPRSLVLRAREGREPAADARGRAVVAFAAGQLGHRYCWGGTGPSCFDCSGLVRSAWESAGVELPRTSGAMGTALEEVPLDEVRAGDILWWPGHVGIYAGDGWSIEALDSRHGVVRRAASNPYRALRPRG
jgi:cell wall-associated NlpC family hydrolase